MGNPIELTEEQGAILQAAIDPALKQLLETGNFHPSLYLHDCDQLTFFTFLPQTIDSLRELARQTINEQAPETLAYALVYDSSLETETGDVDALIIETGDAEDSEALELARTYSRKDNSTSAGIVCLGAASHLLA